MQLQHLVGFEETINDIEYVTKERLITEEIIMIHKDYITRLKKLDLID
jgi:hypothetical protein